MPLAFSGHETRTNVTVHVHVLFPLSLWLSYSREEAYRLLPLLSRLFLQFFSSFPAAIGLPKFAVAGPCERSGRRLRWSLCCPMCKSKSAVAASEPGTRSRSRSSSATISGVATSSGGFQTGSSSEPRQPRAPAFPFNSFPSSASKASSSSGSSLSSLREALPEALVLYTFSELRSATGNFRSNSLPGTSSGWRCSLRGKDAVVFQRRFSGPDPADLPARLGALARSHHSSLVPLLGASIVGDHIYLVHEFAPGATLDDCLRNPRNPSFTPLSTWISRMQVASDLAHGLEYIHLHSSVTAGVHNRLKSSSVIVAEPGFRARICHFGAADLAGDIPAAPENGNAGSDPSTSGLRRTGSRRMRIEGSRDYMAPELFTGGSISRRSDVFAFGVVILELISGDKPVERRGSDRVSLIHTAREAIGAEAEGERRGRVRQWVDRRLRDSFPVDTAEALIQLALRCVEADPAARPDMTVAVGRVSKLFLDSKAWADAVKHPTDISVSFAPR